MGALFTTEDLDDSINAIYQFTPAVNNLYTIKMEVPSGISTSMSSAKSNEAVAFLKSKNGEKGIADIVSLHATKVDLPSEELELSRNPVTKRFALKEEGSFKWVDTLTITWRENKNWDVRRYHDAWLSLFYDKTQDCYVSAMNEGQRNSRYRTFTITFPRDSDNKTPKAKCYGVIPKSTWPLRLEWNTTATPITYTIVYYVYGWEWVTDTQAAGSTG